MYPYLRLAAEVRRHRNAPPLGWGEWHESHVTVRVTDIDPWGEMNNGRVLTLFDQGRAVLLMRMGFLQVARRNGWYGTIAGASVRYRKRMTRGAKLTMRSRFIGHDARFSYSEQSLWRPDGECTVHALMRIAVVSKAGIVVPEEALKQLDLPPAPPLPGWVEAWIAAEAQRPWPPEGG